MVQVGLLGLGTVGSHVVDVLARNGEEIALRAGVGFQVRRIAVAHPAKPRALPVDRTLLTGDAWEVVTDPQIDVVVEVMGGIEPARSYVLRALQQRKSVVTANKQLMATRGRELMEAAAAAGVDLYFEASVGGGIPLIRPIKEGLPANRITEVSGILNGTTNYILTRMAGEGWTFSEALSDAQARGFAEQDPSEDIDGHDAAAKLAILASVCFNTRVTASDVPREGISQISPLDIQYARGLGYVIKLLAIGRDVDGQIEVGVHPTMIPASHPLAAVSDEYNAVLVRGDAVGQVMFYGRGAGGGPTASAIISDLVDVGRNRRMGAAGRVGCGCYHNRPIRDPALAETCFYLGLQALDQPGVFARVAAVFGEEGVSLASIVQKSRGEVADIVLVTHRTQEARMRRVLPRLRELAVLKGVSSVIRVEGDEE